MRIVAFDQVELPLTFPFLDLLFPPDCHFDRIARFEPNQGVHTLARRETSRGLALVLEEVEQRARDGITGPRPMGDIGFAALRGGDAVGDRYVIFAGGGERLELVHRTTTRAVFAKGAMRAARWAVGKPPGVYGIADVLGL
jgi:dihydrodipicolinate reductase